MYFKEATGPESTEELRARIIELETALRPFATGPHARMCDVEDCEETAEAKRVLGLEGTFSLSELRIRHGHDAMPMDPVARTRATAKVLSALVVMSVPELEEAIRLAREFFISAEDLLEYAVRRARNT